MNRCRIQSANHVIISDVNNNNVSLGIGKCRQFRREFGNANRPTLKLRTSILALCDTGINLFASHKVCNYTIFSSFTPSQDRSTSDLSSKRRN